jgi:adenine-specific DNA-methyltransferase
MSSLIRPTTKDLGAFYTPATIADVLAEWVVETGQELLLEPSVGDGALLRAALSCAERRRPGARELRLIGCDLDEQAIAGVRQWLAPNHELLLGSFLDLDFDKIEPVHGVISNPPFTRNHALPKQLRDTLRQRFSIKGAAGIWVAFLLHAMRFLRPGGRMAAVVPRAAMFSTYGQDALTRICDQFEQVEIREMVDRPRWSARAAERGAILLARGYGMGSCLVPKPTRWSATGGRLADVYRGNPACFRQASLSAVRLGELATLSIGAVTGCNKVFLLSEAERLAAGIETQDLRLIASRSRHAKGLRITIDELRQLASEGEPTWLLTPRDLGRSRRGVRNRLALLSAEKRRTVVWLNKRSPWWQVDTGSGCDAIFTYMNDRGPRIVIATDDVRCTNTLHQIRFSPRVSKDDRLIVALSMISSFGQLAAERIGRSYGGGVLKFELTDARRFPILLHAGIGVRSAFARADRALRASDMEKARRIADAVLLPPIFGPSWEAAAAEMMAEALQVRSARRISAKA